ASASPCWPIMPTAVSPGSLLPASQPRPRLPDGQPSRSPISSRRQRGTHEANGPVPEQEMGPARMQAPGVEHVAGFGRSPWPEAVRSRRAVGTADVQLGRPQRHIGRPGQLLARTGIPPTVSLVRAGRALAGQQRVTGGGLYPPSGNRLLASAVLASG